MTKYSLLLILLLASCTETKYRVIHKPIYLLNTCVFEKFTKQEKDELIKLQERNILIGSRIGRNQESCKIVQRANDKRVLKHNEAHNEE